LRKSENRSAPAHPCPTAAHVCRKSRACRCRRRLAWRCLFPLADRVRRRDRPCSDFGRCSGISGPGYYSALVRFVALTARTLLSLLRCRAALALLLPLAAARIGVALLPLRIVCAGLALALAGPIALHGIFRRAALGRFRRRQREQRILRIGTRQNSAQKQQRRDQQSARRQPRAGHRLGHLQPALPQVAAQTQKTGRQQQPQSTADVHDREPKRRPPTFDILRRNERLPQSEQRQRRQREIYYPDAQCPFFVPLFAVAPPTL
jgi:hypothetical protein